MLKDPKLTMKKVRRGSRGRRQNITLSENGLETITNSVTGDTSVAQNKELTMLGAQLATKLKISSHFKPKLNYTKSTISKHETEKPVASNSLKSENVESVATRNPVQNDAIYPTQSTSTLEPSPSCGLETNNTKHNDIMQNGYIEEEEQNRSMTASNITDFAEIESGSNNSSITRHKYDIEDITDKTQEIVLNGIWKTKHKMKSRIVRGARFSPSSQKQVDIHNKSIKKCKKDKVEIQRKSNKKEDPSNSNKMVDINIRKEMPSVRKMERLQKKENEEFLDHIPVQEMKKILENRTSILENVQYVEGTLRVSSKYSHYAYLSMEDGERDLLIHGVINRNRAFDGDVVAARINPKGNWQIFANGQVQKTGTVVCILKKVHPRKITGHLMRHAGKDKPFVIIKPKDQRIPLIKICSKSLPPSYLDQPRHYENMIFFVYVDSWIESNYALGKLLSIVGKIGNIHTELQAILLDNNLDVSPYEEQLLQGLPDNNDSLIDTDIKDREDWRHECIFTIDPSTAVDLDDAVSCKVLDNGNYEIGVHIADVTHYLEFLSPLDKEISKRANTVYLPHTSYHLLPKQLCQVCSLLPGKDRLAFSVIWEMTANAEIVKHRFAKTIIRSCCQMSYDAAQIMIDNPALALSENIVDIKGDYATSLLSDVVNNLFKLSIILQDRRFANGALRLDQPKMDICLDAAMIEKHGSLIPVNYYLQKKTDSNGLIEEFMLLANMTVARQLHKAVPETALLRVHNNPSKHNLTTTCETLRKYGVHLDIETAGTLYASIQRYEQNSECNSSTVDNSTEYIMMVITNVCLRTMARAKYICASIVPSEYDLKHYALNVPFYTHFTSPIRRYSDCIVHRLLYATIMNETLPKQWTAKLCSKIAANCNIKKYCAKIAQEQSVELFFAYMVGLAGGFNAVAIVLDVKEHAMDIILCDTGIRLRVHFKDIKETTATVEYFTDFSVPTIIVNWKTSAIVQKINMFSLVHVRVKRNDETFRLKALLQQKH